MTEKSSSNRDSLLQFLKENQGTEISLKERGGGLSLFGKLNDFSELDPVSYTHLTLPTIYSV